MFAPLTRPLQQGEAPWRWDVESVYQCTWFVFYRCLSVNFSEPCWFDRKTKTGSYTNAKEWLENYRDPWEVKGLDYVPVAGDIVVYDGQYGHVQFMETDVMYSEYANGNPDSFRNGKLADYNGKILGYLHYPYEPVQPVARNKDVNQIQTTDNSLRIRTSPSLNGEIVGYVQLGYYNVLSQKKADGYTWYQIAKDRWCADVAVTYLPKGDEDDFIEEIRRWADSIVSKARETESTVNEMKNDYKKINEIVKRWV